MDGGGDLWWCAVLELVLPTCNDYVGSHSGFFPDLWGLGLGFLPTLKQGALALQHNIINNVQSKST